jgi:hypothetical protein
MEKARAIPIDDATRASERERERLFASSAMKHGADAAHALSRQPAAEETISWIERCIV